MDNNVEVSKDGQEDEDGRRVNLLITKLKLQAFGLEMILGEIVVKVTSMMERSSIQIA